MKNEKRKYKRQKIDMDGTRNYGRYLVCSEKKVYSVQAKKKSSNQGPDHVQVFWKHKSIGNQASD